MIQEEFFQLGKQYSEKHFCAIGYAAFSSGHVTDEMIQEYLEKHEKHPNHHDDDFELMTFSHDFLTFSHIFQSALAETATFSRNCNLWTFSP